MVGRLSLSCLLIVFLCGCSATLDGAHQDLENLWGDEDPRASSDSTALESEQSSQDGNVDTVAAVEESSGGRDQALVLEIEETLDKMGYEPGEVDGKFDPKTEAAIQDFQLDNGLDIDGKPTRPLLEKMKATL